MKSHSVSPENAKLIYTWLTTRGGIKVWKSIDLSDPTWTVTTPADRTDKPSWKAGADPEIVTDPNAVVVVEYTEVKRFHVGVRMGSNGLSLKVTDGGTRRINDEVSKAGEGAVYTFDYGSYENAVIMKPTGTTPLLQWLKNSGGLL